MNKRIATKEIFNEDDASKKLIALEFIEVESSWEQKLVLIRKIWTVKRF